MICFSPNLALIVRNNSIPGPCFHLPFTAVYGSEPNHSLCATILSYYENRHFLLPDGSFDLTTNTVSVTDLMIKKYDLSLANKTQILSDGLAVYSNDYFLSLK